jgi:transporter family protein
VIVPFTLTLVLIQGVQKDLSKFTTTTWIFLVLSALATGLSWLFYFRALQIGDVHKVVPIDKLSFVLSILLGITLFKEKLSAPGWIGVILLIVGTLLVVFR